MFEQQHNDNHNQEEQPADNMASQQIRNQQETRRSEPSIMPYLAIGSVGIVAASLVYALKAPKVVYKKPEPTLLGIISDAVKIASRVIQEKTRMSITPKK